MATLRFALVMSKRVLKIILTQFGRARKRFDKIKRAVQQIGLSGGNENMALENYIRK